MTREKLDKCIEMKSEVNEIKYLVEAAIKFIQWQTYFLAICFVMMLAVLSKLPGDV